MIFPRIKFNQTVFFISFSLMFLHSNAQRKNLIFESTFDSSNSVNQWYEKSIYNTWSALIEKNRHRQGVSSLRVKLIRGKDSVNGPRAELGMCPQTQNEFWYGYSNFFPLSYSSDPATEIINQWQAMPDFNLGENWRSPPLAVEIKSDRFKIAVRWSSDPVNTTLNTNMDYLDLGPVTHNKWTDWVIHVKWCCNNTGILQVWKNDTLVLERLNQPIGYNDVQYPYFKIGIYKWEWSNASTISTSTSRMYYIDDVRVGNALAVYNDVAPKQIQQQTSSIKFNNLELIKNSDGLFTASFTASKTTETSQLILNISEDGGKTFYPVYTETPVKLEEGKSYKINFKSKSR